MKPGALAMRPYLKTVLWGGSRLQKSYGKDAPADQRVGESWEVSALDGRESRDEATGRGLGELFRADPAHFLGPERAHEGFPLLVKLICTTDLLSLQVHPDDAQARRLDGLSAGKREAWLILEAGPAAYLYLGVRDGAGRADLQAALRLGTAEALQSVLRRVPVAAGQVFDLAPGTLHALGPDIVLLEVQQPSDLTYRVSDWARVDSDGRPRALHEEKALAVLDEGRRPSPLPACGPSRRAPGEVLLTHDRFTLERWRIDGEVLVPVTTLLTLTGLGGTGAVLAPGTPEIALSRGRSCVIPRGVGMIRVRGRGLHLATAMPAS